MGRKPKPDAMPGSVRASNYRERLRQQVSANRKQAEALRDALQALGNLSGYSVSIIIPPLTGDSTIDAQRLSDAIKRAVESDGTGRFECDSPPPRKVNVTRLKTAR